MESSQRWKNLLRLFLLAWIGILLLAGLLLKGQKIIAHCLNSDSLYLTTVYQDLFVDGNPLSEWVLSPSPCFFPDMAFYFPLLAVSSDYGYGLTFYGFVYIGTLFILLLGFAYSLEIPLRCAALYLSLALALWVAVLHDAQRFWLDEFLFVAGRHAGTLLSGLLLLWIALHIHRHGLSRASASLFLILSFGAVFSDILILIQFSFPILLVFLLDALWRKKSFRCVGILSAATLLACLLSFYITEQLDDRPPFLIPKIDWRINMGFQAITDSWRAFSRDTALFFLHTKPAFLFFLLGWLIAGEILLVLFLRRAMRSAIRDTAMTGLAFLYLFSFFSLLGSLSAPLLTGIWFSMSEVRYIMPLFVFPLILLAFLTLNHHDKIPYWLKGAGMALILLFASIRIFPDALNLRLNDFRLPYPENVRFVDDVIREQGLHYGYCDYWNGNYLRILSRTPARVNPLHEVLWPYFWINSHQWYWLPDAKDGVRYPKYDFILTDRLDKTRIEKKFGPPAAVRSFKSERLHPHSDTEHDETEIWIYNRAQDFAFRNFIRFFFLGDEFPERTFWPVSPFVMQSCKQDGDPWNAEGNTIIAAGETLEVNFARAASGDMMEISVDAGDAYELNFFGWDGNQIQNQPLGEPLIVSPASGEGLTVRYLPLPDPCAGQEIARITVQPLEGDGHYSVGHLWIYSDTFSKNP